MELPDYIESEEVSRDAEEASAGAEKGLAAYLHVMSNWRFLAACHVRDLDVLIRYGVVSWPPVYYAQAGEFGLKEMSFITLAYPLGIMLGPLTGGYISDRLFGSNRSRVIMLAGLLSCAAISGIALSPPDNIPLAAGLLFLTGFTINLAPLPALALDLVGRRLAGSGAGLLSVHGYIYGALQAWLFGWLSMAVPGGWTWVFAAMAPPASSALGPSGASGRGRAGSGREGVFSFRTRKRTLLWSRRFKLECLYSRNLNAECRLMEDKSCLTTGI